MLIISAFKNNVCERHIFLKEKIIFYNKVTEYFYRVYFEGIIYRKVRMIFF